MNILIEYIRSAIAQNNLEYAFMEIEIETLSKELSINLIYLCEIIAHFLLFSHETFTVKLL